MIGWSMAMYICSKLVLYALNMATWQRRQEQLIHHSDRGTQYAVSDFGVRCREVGDAYDSFLKEPLREKSTVLECIPLAWRNTNARRQQPGNRKRRQADRATTVINDFQPQ